MRRIILLSLLWINFSGIALADNYQLEADHTYAYFKISHLDRGYFTGVFKDVSGSMTLDTDTPRVDVTIQVGSLDSFAAKRDEHLLSPDFFNAKRYRTMKFISTEITQNSETEYAVKGNLTLHGVTKSVEAKVVRGITGVDPWGGYRTGGNVYIKLDRREFGMKTLPPPSIGNDVEIDLYFEALRN